MSREWRLWLRCCCCCWWWWWWWWSSIRDAATTADLTKAKALPILMEWGRHSLVQYAKLGFKIWLLIWLRISPLGGGWQSAIAMASARNMARHRALAPKMDPVAYKRPVCNTAGWRLWYEGWWDAADDNDLMLLLLMTCGVPPRRMLKKSSLWSWGSRVCHGYTWEKHGNEKMCTCTIHQYCNKTSPSREGRKEGRKILTSIRGEMR